MHSAGCETRETLFQGRNGEEVYLIDVYNGRTGGAIPLLQSAAQYEC
jgi:hypothetical protein